ncbi:protein of unknown function [Alcaligenes faecalis subsp. faecalis]|nr:protein of unknown function [Alcaligenes faecalis subsp. faecalis]
MIGPPDQSQTLGSNSRLLASPMATPTAASRLTRPNTLSRGPERLTALHSARPLEAIQLSI